MSGPSTFHRRRWLRIRLWHLFGVMTLVCAWLAWEKHLVHQRQSALVQLPSLATANASASIPVWRTWLGDEAISQLILPPRATDADVARMVQQFPEAAVFTSFADVRGRWRSVRVPKR